MKSTRWTHYFHTLSKHIVERCLKEGIGTIAIGDLSGIRDDEEASESKIGGKHGNFDHHSWQFDCFTDLMTYKVEVEGLTLETVFVLWTDERRESGRTRVVRVR